jgi:SAM-dependent methyltransferase
VKGGKTFTPESLAADFGSPAGAPPRAYYALFLKLLAARVTGEDVPVNGGLAREISARLDGYDAGTLAGGRDLLKPLYQALFPRRARHPAGEYYTPDWLAEHVLDQLGYDGHPDRRVLDPACGSGTFLVAAINRIRRWYAVHRPYPEPELRRRILASVTGLDLNPLAVMAARVNYLIAIRDLGSGPSEIPVHRRDSILDPPRRRVDYVVGNPPWVAWDNLPAGYRARTMPLFEKYGLFTLSGNAARHGGGKKDLSALMLYTAADRYLTDGGRLGFVITQTLFQTKGAGEGFRRFPGLRVFRVDDMVGFRPFEEAANWTAVILLEKGRETAYPVPYFKWRDRFSAVEQEARPIDPARCGSPWMVTPKGCPAASTGAADYTAHLGANTAGANGVFWVEILGPGIRVRNLAEKSKRALPAVERTIEPGLLYPLLRWRDVRPYAAAPSAHILLAQDAARRTAIDETRMRTRWPRTYAYLLEFRERLLERAAYRRYQGRAAFYAMYDIGPYTLAPWKVVWRRMDRRIRAAVVGEVEDPLLGRRPVIPQETCAFIAADSENEAHYLCALLNSAAVNFIVQSHSVVGGKGFGTPGMLDYLPLRRYDEGCAPLAALSREAHRAPGDSIQQEIDRAAARLLGARG